jgi:hypothetical protein
LIRKPEVSFICHLLETTMNPKPDELVSMEVALEKANPLWLRSFTEDCHINGIYLLGSMGEYNYSLNRTYRRYVFLLLQRLGLPVDTSIEITSFIVSPEFLPMLSHREFEFIAYEPPTMRLKTMEEATYDIPESDFKISISERLSTRLNTIQIRAFPFYFELSLDPVKNKWKAVEFDFDEYKRVSDKQSEFKGTEDEIIDYMTVRGIHPLMTHHLRSSLRFVAQRIERQLDLERVVTQEIIRYLKAKRKFM